VRNARRTVRILLKGDDAPSRFSDQCLKVCAPPADALALDAPCGAGRHINALRSRGYSVVAADLSLVLLQEARQRAEQTRSPAGAVSFIQFNAANPLPFANNTFDLVLVVHFFLPELVRRLSALVRPGGYLILETFGAQGGNHADLPFRGQVQRELHGDWSIIDEQERSVRSVADRCVLRLFARRPKH
jgi:SAM-dependent methyltransferase